MNWLTNLFKPHPTTKQLLRLNAEIRRLRAEIVELRLTEEKRSAAMRKVLTTLRDSCSELWWY